jgi:ABC-type Fe3+/spermidine/putrescine transport system ATPase subunit
MTDWVTCRGLAKRLGTKQVLSGLDLSVARGEILSILGPSGSGKTTLIRLIAGLADPDAGEIAIAGTPVFGPRINTSIERRGVGYVFQDYAVWPHMTVAGNVAFGLDLAGLSRADRDARVREALISVDIAELADRFPDQLSGGQQQRLALARSLAMRPEVILLDEPLSNVDAALREHLRLEILQLVRAHGTTAIYITHDQSEAMALCDRLAVMQGGRLLQSGPPEELYRRPNSRFVASFLGGANVLRGTMDGAVFTAPLLRLVSTCPAPCAAVELVFRPEDAAPAEAHPDNVLSGVVVACMFIGRGWRVTLRAASGMFQLDWPRREAEGANLAFSVPPDRCALVPQDS